MVKGILKIRNIMVKGILKIRNIMVKMRHKKQRDKNREMKTER